MGNKGIIGNLNSCSMMKELPAGPTARSEHSRVVFAVSINANFPEMYRTACGLLRSGRFVPVILFTGDADFEYELNLCRAAKLNHIIDPSAKKSAHLFENKSRAGLAVKEARQASFVGDAPPGIRQRLKRLPVLGPILKKVHNIYVRCVVTKTAFICLPWHLIRLQGLRQRARVILRTVQPDVVVVPYVELNRILGCIAIEAKQHGIPVVIIPYTWILREEIIKVLFGKPEYQACGLINRWVSKRYPQWHLRGYLCRPAVIIVAMEWLGFPTANPWMDDNIGDVIALESEVMLRSYVADGVPAHKCRITGSASHDILALAGSKTRDVDSSGTFEASTPNIEVPFALSFLPPDQTGNQITGFEFPSYWDMLLFWIETATAHDTMPVIFSLHPRIKNLRSSMLARFPKLQIHDGDACELIPHARFCVEMFGGMMRYAIACAKPVLHYDVFNYRMNVNELASVPSVITVNGRTAFAETYARFSTDKAYLAGLERDARISAPDWGTLDGCAVERIEALIAANCLQANSS